MRIIPARIALDAAGVPFAPDYGDVYHSADGAFGQARHVFLHGTGLPGRWAGRDRFVVLETGFGLGLNFLATWQAWRDDPARPARLHYVAIEKHPCTGADLASLHAQLVAPDMRAQSGELLRGWPPLTAGAHRIYLDRERITLTLFFGEAESVARRLALQADAIFLDGFAPARNPDMWSPGLFKALARLAAADARLATWSVARPVRDGLAAAGFSLQKLPGYGRKADMLAGNLLPRLQQLARLHAAQAAPQRAAAVIGAGLAGCAVAERLAARGWEVDLIERHAGPAQEASGNLSGLARPMLALDDNVAARFSRTAFLTLRRHLDALAAEALPLVWGPRGVLQLAQDARQAAHVDAAIARQGLPPDYVQCLDAAQVAAKLAWPLDLPGWF
ncbi:MAG: tRNA (5-methylaminomethyl-2-thiouridine)(34)-methyltransferase MnmD, partial [Rhodocyclaceae bacterium]|nr:tRNA (5-methylaminomethyl-2-thiouridine)(34)-methyltransferase MnmD [Rhodocyclaceae bacterium]